MKTPCFFVVLLFACNGHAQVEIDFKPLRYNEDYSYLRNDTSKSGYAALKFRPLAKGGKTFISQGGDIRYQYLGIANENWQDLPWDSYILSRMLLHTDVHHGESLRLFIELQGSMIGDKAGEKSPVEENPLDLHQAFFDVKLNKKSLLLRVGRQEISYGSQRLISLREGPNSRQAFDVARGIATVKEIKAEGFYGRYVTARNGVFDDLSDKDVNVWGIYLTKNKVPLFKNVEWYYLGLSKKHVTFNDGKGDERRHSMGSRIWAKSNRFRYDIESVYQFGRFAGKSISAWTLSFNTSYTFNEFKKSPELGVKTEVISGDRVLGDDKLQTFNPLFPRGAYFGLAALLGPVNLVDIHPFFSLTLLKEKLDWTLDYDVFWRHKEQDGLYGPNGAFNYGAAGSRKKFIGQQLATYLDFTPGRFFTMTFEVTWFKAGAYLKEVSPGRDIVFCGLTSQLKF
jgi:hypothetical protein